MAFVLADRVEQITRTSGLGDIELAEGLVGRRTFASVTNNGDTCVYVIEDLAGGEWEIGLGTVSHGSPDVLQRTTVRASSNADAKVSLSAGTHRVFMVADAKYLEDVISQTELDAAIATHNANTGAHSDATPSVRGFMSAADKTKLDGVETNAKDDQSAAEVPYSNTTSGLTATDAQAAIDEVDDDLDTHKAAADPHAQYALEADLAATTGAATVGTTDGGNVQSDLDKRVTFALSLSALGTMADTALDGDAARLASGTGRDGDFRWNASDLSSTLVLASATSDSVDDTTDTINDADHPFSDGDGVITQTTVNGLTAQTVYWAVNSTSGSYQLSATFGGGAIDLTGTTNVTIDHLLDPLQGVYVTPSSDKTGASGAWVRQYDVLSVKAFGAGGGVSDDAGIFTVALRSFEEILAPRATYIISSFDIPSDRILLTEGYGTVFQQQSGLAAGTRMIKPAGSNIEIQSCTVRGNISTDTGEQHHSIFIQTDSSTGDIDNVKIGDIHGENIRGDVIYFGQTSPSQTLTNVNIGRVTFDNVLRNGVSCVSCDGFSVKSVTGSRCGFTHMDVEANVGSGVCINGKVGYIKGRHFGLVSQDPADYIDNVEVEVLDLSPSNAAQSDPVYTAGSAIEDGLLLRNVKKASIGKASIEGFNRSGVFLTSNPGELGVEDLYFGSLTIDNCAITDETFNAFIHWNSDSANNLRIGHINSTISGTNKRVINNCVAGHIGSATINAQSEAAFLRSCNDMQVDNLVQTGATGFGFVACNRIAIKSGSLDGDRLASTSNKCSFENFTATAATFLFSSGDEDHFVANSTLNGDYFGWGTPIRDFGFTMRFGDHHLWVDTTGDLRIKNGAPTSDTDGTVVGVQA